MQQEEWLRILRQREEGIVWEPRGGLLGSLRRLFGMRAYALHRASHISATVIPVDQAFSLVRLEADFSMLLRTMASQTVAGAAVGTMSAGAMVLMGFMLPVAVVPAIGLTTAAYATSRRTHRAITHRALLTLEQTLDRLERGESQPPSLFRLIESALPPGAR
jgi:uncharacterized membrane protein YphA (DoxX/SURF4 family)